MQEAQKASEEARKKLADIESRLSNWMWRSARCATPPKKKARPKKRASKLRLKKMHVRSSTSAEQEIAAAAKAARRQLTAHAADLAVGLAQKQIHVDAATDQSLVRSFAGQLGEIVRGPGKGPELSRGFRRQHLRPSLRRCCFRQAARRDPGCRRTVAHRDAGHAKHRTAAGVGEPGGSRGPEAKVAGCDCATRRHRQAGAQSDCGADRPSQAGSFWRASSSSWKRNSMPGWDSRKRKLPARGNWATPKRSRSNLRSRRRPVRKFARATDWMHRCWEEL